MLDSINLLYLILLFICILLSAFFSSSETAFISLQKMRLRHLVTTGVAGAEQVAKLTEHPERLLITLLLGNNFVNTAAAALGTMIAISIFGNQRGVIIATIVVTMLLLVFGEIGPKTLATRLGERMALIYVRPVELVSRVLLPIVVLFDWIGAMISRIVGGLPMPGLVIGEEEIRAAVSAGREQGTVEQAEAEMVERVFRFGDRQVAEMMTPRPEISWIQQGTRLPEFLSIYAGSPHSRFPVYEETIDNVVGILWIKDVLMAQARDEINAEIPVTDLARPAYFVPESKLIGEMFAEMQAVGQQTAIVIDEFGGTAGFVTLSQLVEEIVGELGDELAKSGKAFETIDINTFQIDGGMRIEEANDELGLNLPEGQYETVAGFVLSLLGHIPKEGEQLKHDGLTLVVTEMRGVKIKKILITRG